MRIGKTTTRGWIGVTVRDGRLMFGVVPHRVIGIDFRTSRVLPEMVKKTDNDFFTSLREYVTHWWSLGRPGPVTMVRGARAYGRFQRFRRAGLHEQARQMS